MPKPKPKMKTVVLKDIEVTIPEGSKVVITYDDASKAITFLLDGRPAPPPAVTGPSAGVRDFVTVGDSARSPWAGVFTERLRLEPGAAGQTP